MEELPSRLSDRQATIGTEVMKEINKRLDFLLEVGLGYLDLDRPARTLSGGESQRIRLATQIGSQLVGVLYILDEPSIGLHQRDNERLIGSLLRLRDLGNSVLVVEHDKDMMLASDYIIDLGPAAGVHGGEVVAEGTPEQILNHPKSATAEYLGGKREIAIPSQRRQKAIEKRGSFAAIGVVCLHLRRFRLRKIHPHQ
jgi:excinuclease ABC subunit A